MAKNKCIDCGKEISGKSKRCKSCSNRNRKGKYNSTVQKMEKSQNWRGGISLYRTLVKKEKCELCGKKIKLIIHHKDGNRHNNGLSNLQVLCTNCHAKVDNRVNNFHKNK